MPRDGYPGLQVREQKNGIRTPLLIKGLFPLRDDQHPDCQFVLEIRSPRSSYDFFQIESLLFSDTVGAGLNIIRNGIGSTSNFMNSIEPFSPGLPSSPPHYTFNHNDSGQLWMSEAAQSYGVSNFYGDAWSAPGYMKTDDDDSNGGYFCGVTNTSCKNRRLEASVRKLPRPIRPLLRTIRHKGHAPGLPKRAPARRNLRQHALRRPAGRRLHPRPRPHRQGRRPRHQTHLLRRRRLRPASCHAAWPQSRRRRGHPLCDNHADSAPTTPLDTKCPVWQTEWTDLSGAYTPTIFFANGEPGEGLTWAAAIQTAFVDANVSAFLYWIGAENASTGNSVLINLDGNSYIASKRLWAFAQFSWFVKPAAQVSPRSRTCCNPETESQEPGRSRLRRYVYSPLVSLLFENCNSRLKTCPHRSKHS